jgi:hypothetical protein
MRPWSEHPRGWDTYTIRQLLQNPTIAGKRVYRGEVIGDADWEPLQQRLDEAADRYAAGELPMSMLTRIETTLRPKIEQAQRALVPPISDENIRALVTTGDVRAAWAELPLAEQRKIIKAVFDVRVQRTANRGQNAFEPERVLIAPRVR